MHGTQIYLLILWVFHQLHCGPESSGFIERFILTFDIIWEQNVKLVGKIKARNDYTNLKLLKIEI